MFPTPLEKRSRSARITYQAFPPVALLFWLLPLLAVAIFTIKPGAGFTNANYWGIPSSFDLVENYGQVFSTLTCRAIC